jgi:hypothetical protein
MKATLGIAVLLFSTAAWADPPPGAAPATTPADPGVGPAGHFPGGPFDPIFGKPDNPADCEYWGRITYRNTVKRIMDVHCTSCHGRTIDDATREDDEAWSNAPAVDWFHLGRVDDMTTGTIGMVCNAFRAGTMPPPQSQAALETGESADLEAWCDRYDDGASEAELQGSFLPAADVQGVNYNRFTGNATITYAGGDPDSAGHVALYYDTDREGFDGTLIAGCLPPTPGFCTAPGECTWTPSTYIWSVPGGGGFPPRLTRYWVYMCTFDDETVTCDYSPNAILVF